MSVSPYRDRSMHHALNDRGHCFLSFRNFPCQITFDDAPLVANPHIQWVGTVGSLNDDTHTHTMFTPDPLSLVVTWCSSPRLYWNTFHYTIPITSYSRRVGYILSIAFSLCLYMWCDQLCSYLCCLDVLKTVVLTAFNP